MSTCHIEAMEFGQKSQRRWTYDGRSGVVFMGSVACDAACKCNDYCDGTSDYVDTKPTADNALKPNNLGAPPL